MNSFEFPLLKYGYSRERCTTLIPTSKDSAGQVHNRTLLLLKDGGDGLLGRVVQAELDGPVHRLPDEGWRDALVDGGEPLLPDEGDQAVEHAPVPLPGPGLVTVLTLQLQPCLSGVHREGDCLREHGGESCGEIGISTIILGKL